MKYRTIPEEVDAIKFENSEEGLRRAQQFLRECALSPFSSGIPRLIASPSNTTANFAKRIDGRYLVVDKDGILYFVEEVEFESKYQPVKEKA